MWSLFQTRRRCLTAPIQLQCMSTVPTCKHLHPPISAAASSQGDKPGRPHTLLQHKHAFLESHSQVTINPKVSYKAHAQQWSSEQLISAQRLTAQEDSWRKYSLSEGIPSIIQNSWRRIHPSVRFKCQHNKGTPLPAPPASQIHQAGKGKLHREQQLIATRTVHRPSLAITTNKTFWGLFLEREDRGTWKKTASS